LVIGGEIPVLVDTCPRPCSARWLDDVWSVIELADVCWLVVTADHPDRWGGVEAALTACPQATVIAPQSVMAQDAVPADRWLPPTEYPSALATVARLDPSPANAGADGPLQLIHVASGLVWPADVPWPADPADPSAGPATRTDRRGRARR